MGNPFDLKGPEFLLFYGMLSAVVLTVAWLVRRVMESSDSVYPVRTALAGDPYKVAALRGGKTAMLSVSMLSLIDRGLLAVSGTNVSTAGGLASVEKVRRPLEKAILQKYLVPGRPDAVHLDGGITVVAEGETKQLEEAGLLPNAAQRAFRNLLLLAVLVVLLGVAGYKIHVALARGRHNILFLAIMAVVAALVARALVKPRVTPLGDDALKQIREQCRPLYSRRKSLSRGGSGLELALLAAVFGFTALPDFAREETRGLRLGDDSIQSTTGSSCGSSCSSGSCGGGGCGGGCGGCG